MSRSNKYIKNAARTAWTEK